MTGLRTLEKRLERLERAARLDPVRRARYHTAIGWLRDAAADAEAVTVTSGNAVQVLQVTVDRMAVFFEHFADLLEAELRRG